MLYPLAPFGAALILAYALTPLVIRGAHRVGALDVPTDERRAHSVPVPRMGGVAVVVAISLTWLSISVVSGAVWNPLPPQYGTAFFGIVLGTGLVFLAGLFDDLWGLSPLPKLVLQISAALVVVGNGLTPDAVAIAPSSAVWHAGQAIGSGVFVFWIVGITNAFNLIDGLDGLASSFALLAAAVVLCCSLVIQGGISPILPTIIAGALLGFIRYNWSPARIFLGDAGSMTLGFLFAVLTIIAGTDKEGVTYPIIPLFALAFPITDTLVAVARRWIRGVPFSLADGRHIHHQIRRNGLGVPQTVLILSITFASIAAAGITVTVAPSLFSATTLFAVTSLSIFAILYGLRWLRYEEFIELCATLRTAIGNPLQDVRLNIYFNDAADRILKANDTNEIRTIINNLADQIEVLGIELIEPGQKEKAHPPSQQITPIDGLPLCLDYTFYCQRSTSDRIIIRVWTRFDITTKKARMEQVVVRICWAVAVWFASNPWAIRSATTNDKLLNNTAADITH